MASFTGKASGSWQSSGQTTWNEAGVPGNGDTVVTGAHDITLDADTIIGASVAATLALTVSAGGSFTNNGFAFTPRGNITAAGNITFNAGSSLIWDSTQTASPTTTRFNLKITSASAALITRGASGNRVTITSDTTGGSLAGYFENPSTTNGNGLDCQYTTFSKIGDASQVNQFVGKSVLSNVIFDNCGRYDSSSSNIGAAIDVDWSDVNFTNTPAVASTVGVRIQTTASTTGLRRLRKVRFDKQAWFNISVTNWDVDGVYTTEFLRWGEPSGTSGGSNVTLKNIFSAASPSTAQMNANFTGSIDGMYSLMPAASLRHSIDIEPVTAGTLEVKNCVLESLGTADSAPDLVVNNEITSPQALTLDVHNNVILPTSDGEASGSVCNIARNARNITVKVDHNTFVAGKSAVQGGASIIEGSTALSIGRPGLISSCRSNICWANTGKEGHLLKAISSFRSASNKEEVDRGTLTGVDATSFSDSTRTWTAGIFTNVQCYIRMTSGAASGQVTAIASNTLTTTAVVASWAIQPSIGDTYVIFCKDFYDPANVGYNCLHNVLTTGIIYRPDGTTTTGVTGYHGHYITSGTPGGSDITVDPDFVDSARNLAAWSVSQGYAASGDTAATKIANAKAQLLADTSLIATLLLWVMEGFAPQEATLENAGHDSVTPGAVEGVFSSGHPMLGIGISATWL